SSTTIRRSRSATGCACRYSGTRPTGASWTGRSPPISSASSCSRLLGGRQAHPRADRDLVRDQAGVGPVSGADPEVLAAHGGPAGERGLRARRPGAGQGQRLLHSVQRQHADGGVAVLAHVAGAGGAVARLLEGGGVDKGLAAHL